MIFVPLYQRMQTVTLLHNRQQFINPIIVIFKIVFVTEVIEHFPKIGIKLTTCFVV